MADALPPPPALRPLASLGSRLAARLLDGLLVVLVSVVPILLMADIDIDEGVFDIPSWLTWSTWLAGVAYEVLAVALTGKTLGKHLLGIRVVDEETAGLPDLGQATRRASPTLLGAVPVLGGLSFLLYLPVLWNPRRKGLHDAIAETVVVRA